MRLEDLYENFVTASPEQQARIISAYRLRRAEELAKPTPTAKKQTTSSASRSKIDLSAEEKAVMKMLGLKQKDILALRATVEVEEDEDDASLLADNTFADDADDEEED